eukprot:m.168940 g.168940  ORF g.168940 m.168940 type:complete len:552 (+) comp31542_c2_seq7:185-1840(+)
MSAVKTVPLLLGGMVLFGVAMLSMNLWCLGGQKAVAVTPSSEHNDGHSHLITKSERSTKNDIIVASLAKNRQRILGSLRTIQNLDDVKSFQNEVEILVKTIFQNIDSVQNGSSRSNNNDDNLFTTAVSLSPETLSSQSTKGTTQLSKPPIVVGHCEGTNLGHIPDQEQFGRLLLQAAFPERVIEYNRLSKDCSITSDSKYPHTDVIINIGWGHNQKFKDAVTNPPENHKLKAPPNGIDELLVYNRAKVVRHYIGRTFVIGIHNEAHGGSGHLFDLMIESKMDPRFVHTSTTSFFWPMAARWIWQGRWRGKTVEDLVVKPDFDAAAVLKSKTRFAAFRHKSCDKKFYSRHAVTRVALFDVLSKYKQVDGLGLCRGDRELRKKYNIEPKEADKNHFTGSSVDTFAQYKFAFAMENNFVDGYWTEKMINGIFAQSIPIMAGFKNKSESLMARWINMDRVVYCQFDQTAYEAHDFPNTDGRDARTNYLLKVQAKQLDLCVEQIKKIDQDDELYISMLKQPFLIGNQVDKDEIFGMDLIGRNLRKSFEIHESYLLD